ncbi:putative ribonuclease H-like domain-containing protein [Tanacetum coccineum]
MGYENRTLFGPYRLSNLGEEIIARERERKARTTLLMALPEDHLAKFHKMTNAKEMWDAIKSRDLVKDESKKNAENQGKSRQQEEGCMEFENQDGIRTGTEKEDSKALVTLMEKTQPSESESQTSEFDTCESNISTEPSELVSEPVVNESNIECQPKVWSDAPIIEEYESDSEDEYVSIPTKEQETPSFANQQVKTPRETVKNQYTHSQKPKVDKKELGYGFTVRACFVCGSLNHLIRDCDFHEKRMARKAELNNGWNKKSSQREKRPIWNNVHRVNKQNQFVPSAVLTRTGKIPVNTARTSGTKNISTARQSFNRQAVLTSTADKVNTHFNLFSVSQMCDKKNKVLFTDSECLVLSPEFKLPDENQVLLKIPRQNNMYSFNLENIVPSGGLACLIAKATIDESNKWHRRLGHVNFKNLNKLVKGNLVRGLPSKIFQNDHTCVACQKGKQHKASCKAKSVSSISHSLQLLHMDLFGPTFVRSLNHKTYCLVITDDFSRFSWVFFLRTKDETSGILKDFIRQIKNQLNQKVKTIRCDNGIKFKNKDVIEFCESKGIKREYSNARTPQQNGVAERKNTTLIKAARTMLADSFLPNTFWAEAVSTACYVLNRVLVTKPHNKTPYELLTGKGPTWLFDLDYLTDSMNYQPVRSENQANKHASQQEANHNAAEAAQKMFEHLVIKEGAARTSSTNIFSIVSTPAKANSNNPLNTASIPVSTASPYEGLSLSDLTNPEEDDFRKTH